MKELIRTREIEVFNIKDNDIVIVRPGHLLSEEDNKKVEVTWSNIFKEQGFKNIKVIVASGVRVNVLTKE